MPCLQLSPNRFKLFERKTHKAEAGNATVLLTLDNNVSKKKSELMRYFFTVFINLRKTRRVKMYTNVCMIFVLHQSVNICPGDLQRTYYIIISKNYIIIAISPLYMT